MNRIKILRKKNGVSQQKLAKELHTSQANISAWELGRWQPDQERLKELAKYFNVSIDYLLGVTNNLWTPEDYANGVVDSVPVNITADDEDILDMFHEVQEVLGDNGKVLIIDFCKALISKFKQ